MKIHIEDKLYLESDGTQYILKLYSGKKNEKGEETYKSLGYFGKLQHAIKHIVRLKIKESQATTLKELMQDIKKIDDWIEEKIYY